MDNRPSILFVDDEPNILKALRRLFYAEEWDLFFAGGGREGLKIIDEEEIDLVVTDYRMPEMNGFEFLLEVQKRSPETVRGVLSGYAEKKLLIDALASGVAKFILEKPWEEEELKKIISDSLLQSLEHRKSNYKLQDLINNIPALPPLPEVYVQLRSLLAERESVRLEDVCSLLEQDVGITTSLLRWSNSPVFGQLAQVDTLRRAIVVLGLDVVEGLVLSETMLKSFDSAQALSFHPDEYQKHCMGVAILSRLLFKRFQPAAVQEHLDQAFTVGLMHDMGKLVLAQFFHEDMDRAMALAKSEALMLRDAEMQVLGVCHEEVGAYLAAWWSLPDFIVEAVRWHHQPEQSRDLSLLAEAVQVADLVAQQFEVGLTSNYALAEIDDELKRKYDLMGASMEQLREAVEQLI